MNPETPSPAPAALPRKYPSLPAVYQALVEWFRHEGQEDWPPERRALEFMFHWCPVAVFFGPHEELQRLERDLKIADRLAADSSRNGVIQIAQFHGMDRKDVRQLTKRKSFRELTEGLTPLPLPTAESAPPAPGRSPAALISDLMDAAKLNDGMLATDLRVSRSTISLVRRGKILPSRGLAEKLAKRFKLPPAVFIFGDINASRHGN